MTTASGQDPEDQRRRSIRFLVRAGLPLVVLVAGGALAIALVETGPKAERKPPTRQARLVDVQSVRFSRQRTVMYAMGTVHPAREVELRPRVTGEIIAISDEFVPGGRFLKGETVLQIDPTDYELAVEQRESEVAEAQSTLALELGQQSIAKREYELLGETIADEDRALVLRQPQLESVRANLKTAQAALQQAKLNLDRTTVRAPFNAVVRTRGVNVGMQATTLTPLATLVGADQYWVEVTLPVDQLQWIEIPGSTVRVFNEAAWGEKRYREGRVIRLLSDLEEEGRMARLLVAVDDPLALKPERAGQPQLLLGDYVRAELAGIELDSVAAVNRRLFHEGDQVWVMNDKDELEIRPVAIAFRGRDQLFVSEGLRHGERLVTTDLPSPVEGMPLRTQDESPSPDATKEEQS